MHRKKLFRFWTLFFVNFQPHGICYRTPPSSIFHFSSILCADYSVHFRYCPVGRSFYSPDLGRRQPLGEGLESWRGFYQSIRPTQMGLSLNIGEQVFLGLILVLLICCRFFLFSGIGILFSFIASVRITSYFSPVVHSLTCW